MKSLVDVNVLLPLVAGGHPFHDAAARWFDEMQEGSVGWCLLTRLGVLRHLSNPKVMGRDILQPSAALALWDTLSSDDRLEGISDVPAAHEAVFRDLVRGRVPSPGLWTDAWLAALAEVTAREMVTFDRGFRAFGLSRLSILAR